MNVGFVGLGQMGSGMAARLLSAGHEVTVYNRTAEKARPLIERGARLAGTVAEAAGGEVVFTMLADDAAVAGVTRGADGILGHLSKGFVHISSSTISVRLAEELTAEHQSAGQVFVSAPVFGRPTAAAEGKLFVVAAGPPEAIERVTPLFDAVGQRTFVVADRPAAANLVKLSGNFLIGSVIEALGEAMALVEKGGVDRHEYLDLLTSTLFAAPVYQVYGGIIADRRFTPAGFPAHLGLKDVRLALAAGESLQVPLPIASLLRDRYLNLLANGGEDLDWSAIARLAAKDAGLL